MIRFLAMAVLWIQSGGLRHALDVDVRPMETPCRLSVKDLLGADRDRSVRLGAVLPACALCSRRMSRAAAKAGLLSHLVEGMA